MRISDWSSDVCSSDLTRSASPRRAATSLPTRCRRYGISCRTPRPGPPRMAAKRAAQRSPARARADQGRMESPEAIHRPCESALPFRSEEHTSELQSLMRISYAVFCLKKKKKIYECKDIQHIQENK